MTMVADAYYERFRHVRERLKAVNYKFNFEGLHYPRFEMAKKVLAGANFSHASLIGANFKGTDLTDASFRGANLRLCDFSEAILDRADFAEADLNRSLFRGARLAGTRFIGADLTFANLTDAAINSAVWTDAKLKGANFIGIDLRHEATLQGWQLLDVRGLERDLMPEWLLEDLQDAKARVDAAAKKFTS
ncbi:MAG: pentapeptide repeat-containing protein [Minwuia sp.]|nr:pentapeptide repeat-containing protein [Minwuia sp.]